MSTLDGGCGIDEIDVSASFGAFGDIDVSDIQELQPLPNVELGELLNDKSEGIVELENASSAVNSLDDYMLPDIEPKLRRKPKGTNVIKKSAARAVTSAKISQKKRRFCAVESCTYSTPHAKDLARHMRKHTGEKPFQCSVCSKCFSRFDKLKSHKMTHTNVRPFKCDHCSYAAADPGTLKKHIRTHTNERPFKCQLCPYQAKGHADLVVHLRHHTGDTPYACRHDSCSSAFKTQSDLQRHIRLHSGEKPHACLLCPYRSAVKCNLKTHIRRMHEFSSAISLQAPDFQQNTVEVSGVTKAIAPPLIDSTDSKEPEQYAICSSLEAGKSKAKAAKKSGRNQQPRKPKPQKSQLPYQYACKYCKAKCDTLKTFQAHIQEEHKDLKGVLDLKQTRSGNLTVIVNPARKRGLLKPDVAKLFECGTCKAAFAREDSLRVHLRQHNDYQTVSSSTYSTTSGSSALNEGSRHVSHLPEQKLHRSKDEPAVSDHPDMPIIVRNGPVQGVYVIVRNAATDKS